MSKLSSILKAAGIVAAVVVVGIVLGWLGTRGSVKPPGVPTVSAPSNLATAGSVVGSAPKPAGPAPVQPQEPLASETPLKVSAAPANLLTNWEDKVDEILSSSRAESDKAKQMLEFFPRLPEDGQVEVAQHLSNLVSDQDYPALAQYLTNAATPEPVLDVLMADALNRPNSLKLPLLLGVAQDDKNPKAGEAKDLLELFLEADYGKDWTAWRTNLDQWLKDNPD